MKKIYTLLTVAIFMVVGPIQAQWSQLGLDIDGTAPNDRFGMSLSISSDGSTIIAGGMYNHALEVGAGNARVYEWNGTAWIQKGNDLLGTAADDYFGSAVSINSDGQIIAIASNGYSGNGYDEGLVQIFEWNGRLWIQKGGNIIGESSRDRSGSSIAINSDGNTIAIGSSRNDGTPANNFDIGHVRIFEWSGSNWIQKGMDIDGEAVGDQSGAALDISDDGDIVAIGATSNDGGGLNSAGHVRVFEWIGTSWVQRGSDIDGEEESVQSGGAVALNSDGDVLAVGARQNSGAGSYAGHVRIFEWNGNNYVPKGRDIDGLAPRNYNGVSISMNNDGNKVAIGAPQGGVSSGGYVRIYDWSGTSWIQNGNTIHSESKDDFFGYTVAMNGDGSIVAAGARYNGNERQGQVRVFYDVLSLGFESEILNNQYQLYPNPNNGSFKITLGDNYSEMNIAITDLTGRMLLSKFFSGGQVLDISITEPAGVYLLTLQSKKSTTTMRLVIE